MQRPSAKAPLPYVTGPCKGEPLSPRPPSPPPPLASSPLFSRAPSPGPGEGATCGFTQRLEEAAEERLGALLDELWAGTRSAAALEAAQRGPRAAWNPYRPPHAGPGAWPEVLNSLVYEFREGIPGNSLFVSGVGLARTANRTAAEGGGGEGETGGGAAEDCGGYIPHDLDRLRVEGHTLPIANPAGLSSSDRALGGFEEIFSQHGAPPVDVFALDDTNGVLSPSAKYGETAQDSTAAPIIPPEILNEIEMLVFDKLWAEVVVPYYVEEFGDNYTGITKDEESEKVSGGTSLPKIASSKLSKRGPRRFPGDYGGSNGILRLQDAKPTKKVANPIASRGAARFGGIRHDTKPKPDERKVSLNRSVRTRAHARVLREEVRVVGIANGQDVLEGSPSKPKGFPLQRRSP